MRNLKKFLALVLAMMMALSLMVTVNAASSTGSGSGFSDANAIDSKYAEAIEVLNELNVLTGYDSGVFLPTNPIRRGEFAAILYRIHSGKPDNTQMDAWASFADDFTDVGTKHWSAGAVGYVSYFDLMIGKDVDVGIFAPEAFINGDEVLVSLLRAMGLEEKDEFSGDGWNRRARGVAQSIGILNTVTLPVLATEEYATREQVAQLAYEALIYTKTGPVTHYTLGGEEHYDTATDAYNYAKDHGVAEVSRIEQHIEYPGSLAATRFNGLHQSVSGSEDKFGRPTSAWNYGNETTVFENLKTPDFQYNGDLTGREARIVERALNRTAEELKAASWYNGAQVAEDTTDAPAWRLDEDGVATGLWADTDHGIPGLEVFVYSGINRVVIREAYVAEIGEIDREDDPITVYVHEVGYGSNNNDGVELEVTKDSDWYETVAAIQGQYVAIYVRPEFSDEDDWEPAGLVDVDDVILEIDPLTDVIENAIITEIDIGVNGKWESKLEANGQWYGFNAEALLLNSTAGGAAKSYTDDDGNTTYLHYNNVLNGIVLNEEAIKNDENIRGDVYLHNGYILLIDQTEVEPTNDPDVGYAYFYDVIEVAGSAATNGGYAWDSDGGTTSGTLAGGTSFRGRLLLPNGNVLGGDPDAGVPIYYADAKDETRGTVTSKFWDYEDILGNLVFFAKNSSGGYDIYPINGVNLGGVTNTKVHFSNETHASAFPAIDPADDADKLVVTPEKSEGIMPSTTALEDLLDGLSANVAFDSKTAFYVIKTGTKNSQDNYLMDGSDVYDIYSIADLNGLDINRALITVVGDYDTSVASVAGFKGDPASTALDGTLDADSKLQVARVVLIVDAGDAPTPQAQYSYFIVRNPNAELVKVYRDKDGQTGEIWYRRYDAVVDGNLETVLVEQSIADAAPFTTDGYWLGTAGEADRYKDERLIDELGVALDPDTLVNVASVTEYKNERIGIDGTVAGDSDTWANFASWTEQSSESYLVKTGGKAFVYDLVKGRISQINISDFTSTSVAEPNGKYRPSVIDGGIAIRDSSHKILTALFINIDSDT